MREIVLPGSGRRTSQLGFGCAYLTPQNAYLLDVAYDAGIRHFDVGRSYNRGNAEAVLGRFLAKHGDEVSVTSKYGILPEDQPVHIRVARMLVGPFIRRLRDRGLLRRPPAGVGMHRLKRAAFTADEARESLKTSLRLLRRDRLDLFLMHEARAAELRDEGLLSFLNESVARGVIGAFGVGGPAIYKAELQAEVPEYCGVLQFDWTALDPLSFEAPFTVRYRVFSRTSAKLSVLLDDTATLRAWSDVVDFDLVRPGEAQRLLFKVALETKPQDLILVSSTKPTHILANVNTAEDSRLVEPALALARLVLATPTGLGA